MEQLNPQERAYLAGFRDGYRRAMSELRGESDDLLERQRAGLREEQARLENWSERLQTKCDRLDAIENFNMTELRPGPAK
jgi:hypothetical protein